MGKDIELQNRAGGCIEVRTACLFPLKLAIFLVLTLLEFFGTCLSGVSLPDDDPDAGQGSKFCLVAIGRLQVGSIFQWFNIALSEKSTELNCSV